MGWDWLDLQTYPLVNIAIAIENRFFPLKVVIFHSYVKLPEGIVLRQFEIDWVVYCSIVRSLMQYYTSL